MIVLDASALIDLLLREEGVKAIEDRVFAPGESLNAPHLIDLEVAQVLRRYRLAGELSDSRAENAFDDGRGAGCAAADQRQASCGLSRASGQNRSCLMSPCRMGR